MMATEYFCSDQFNEKQYEVNIFLNKRGPYLLPMIPVCWYTRDCCTPEDNLDVVTLTATMALAIIIPI